jgi:glycine/D-amino acid oxidase-like deaminating enzyme/nitrite reductase/ring-hydroxylating ferredoxin subunit
VKPVSGATVSTWMATADVPEFPRLTQNEEADVCIVGAGIAGITTAYLLLKAGKSIILLDDGPIAGGETQRTTAHLTNIIDDRYYEIQRIFGKDKARLAYEAHTAAIDEIEQIVADELIDCDFRRVDGYLFNGPKQSLHQLKREFKACKKIGVEDMEWLEQLPFPVESSAGARHAACIRFGNQAQFHPLKYLAHLAESIRRMGGIIHNYVHVTGIEDGEPVVISTDARFEIRAHQVVVATNSPISDWVKVHTKQAPYRTYVVAGKVPKGSVPTALFWDTESPYHYVRTQPLGDGQSDMLIVGGEDHRTGESNDAEARFQRLALWAREHFPQLEKIEQRWSGQVCETIDGLAFIGRDPAHGKNVFIATGDSGQGMTHGTIAGILLSDLIMGMDNPWTEVFSPARTPIEAGLDWLKENANTAAQYMDYLRPGDVKAPAEIAPGEGAVIQHAGEQIAAYRDEHGQLWQCSAVCPHLKGIVAWNSCEKSWDCPAHGSRFTCLGEVRNGPANDNLKQIAADKQLDDSGLWTENEITDLGAFPPADGSSAGESPRAG